MFFTLSQFLLEPFHLPTYPTLYFLSLLKKKFSERKHLHAHPKICKSKTSKTKYTVELILCCSTTPGHRAYHEVWAIYPVRLH